MRKIMVANPKGGSGKSTLAVHLASWFAQHDEIVYLGDLDRQQSSRHWLENRPSHLALIRHWEISDDEFEMPLKNCNFAILDTPAGLHGKRLKQALSEMDRVVVPVSEVPSVVRLPKGEFHATSFSFCCSLSQISMN